MSTVLDKPETTANSIERNPEILERLILTNLIALNDNPDDDIYDCGWALTDLLGHEVDDAVDLMLDGYDAQLMRDVLISCTNFIVETAAALTSKTSIEAHEDTVERFNTLKSGIRTQFARAKEYKPQTREDRAKDRRIWAVLEARARGDYDGDGGEDRYEEDLRTAKADPIGAQ